MIRNIWCVGRNFASHARELGNVPPKDPIIFLKAGSCAVDTSRPFKLPLFSTQVEYELEIALELGPSLMPEHICLAIDLTARDIQNRLKQEGLPWTLAKSFPDACPIGPLWPFPGWDKLQTLSFSLEINEKKVQLGNVSSMIFPPEELHTYLLTHFPVRPGDILLLGTPEGVTRATSGDVLRGLLSGHPPVVWHAL